MNGALADDPARDAAYTAGLAERVTQAYRRDNVVLPTSVVAFAAFEQLRASARHGDLHRMLREASVCPVTLVRADLVIAIERLMGELRVFSARGGLRLGPEVRTNDAEAILGAALRVFATYHRVPVLTIEAGGIGVGEPRLLFYYRNRLDGYGLCGAPTLGAAP